MSEKSGKKKKRVILSEPKIEKIVIEDVSLDDLPNLSTDSLEDDDELVAYAADAPLVTACYGPSE